MEIVQIWQGLEKNATRIMILIFLPHYMWAENDDTPFVIQIEHCEHSNRTIGDSN